MLLITCAGIGSLFADAASSGMKAPANTLVQFSPCSLIARLMIDLTEAKTRRTDAELIPRSNRWSLNTDASEGCISLIGLFPPASFKYSIERCAPWKKVLPRPVPLSFKYVYNASSKLTDASTCSAWAWLIRLKPNSLLWKSSSLRLSQCRSSLSDKVAAERRALSCDRVRRDIITLSLLKRLWRSAGTRRE